MTHFYAAEAPSSPREQSRRGSWRKLVNASEGEQQVLEEQGEFLLQIPLRIGCSYLGEFCQKRPDQKKLVNPIHEVPSDACSGASRGVWSVGRTHGGTLSFVPFL